MEFGSKSLESKIRVRTLKLRKYNVGEVCSDRLECGFAETSSFSFERPSLPEIDVKQIDIFSGISTWLDRARTANIEAGLRRSTTPRS